jgi:hypothetical protein
MLRSFVGYLPFELTHSIGRTDEPNTSALYFEGPWPVNIFMALGTESDQIGFGIVTQRASTLPVVNLEIGGGSTTLAAPSIAL